MSVCLCPPATTAQEPGQLLAVYKQLEESNLFYIQNAQVRRKGGRGGGSDGGK